MIDQALKGLLCLSLVILTSQNLWSQCGDNCDRCSLCGCDSRCPAYWECLSGCPLILDLDGDGFRFGGPENPVALDLFQTGVPEHFQWVLPNSDDAFLAMDLNRNGSIDDGTELFGNGTLVVTTGERAINGFQALSQYDTRLLGGNDDGTIDEDDLIWEKLVLWFDADADGQSFAGEVFSLEDVGVKSLDLIAIEQHKFDDNQNWLRFWSSFFMGGEDGPTKQSLLDVYLLKLHPTSTNKQEFLP